jgi:hypothetical protein|mmetsp:Transcript_4715/g.15745  ORF Transcript_4715/g.15745 Transcript_4715/m.15745 type:complete len:85 (+) Transcript_4715:334-588(+)
MIGYPEIQTFQDDRLPNLRASGYDIDMAFKQGAPPVLHMFALDEDEPEVVRIDKWSAEMLEEFLTSKLTKLDAGALDAGVKDEL